MKKKRGLAKRLLTGILSAMLILAALPVSAFAFTTDETNKTITVTSNDGASAIQDAINAISEQSDPTGWTIVVGGGEYSRFTVLTGLTNLTVKAASSTDSDGNTVYENVVVSVLDDSNAPATTSGTYPETGGVSIRDVDGVTLEGLTFQAGREISTPWYAAAVSTYVETTTKVSNLTIRDCTFEGVGSNYGVMIGEVTSWTVTGCTFNNFEQGVYFETNGVVDADNGVTVTNNTFEDCSFAIHGSYGYSGGSNGGTLTFSGNTVIGTDALRNKVVIEDYAGKGAIGGLTITNNTFSYAMIGLVNFETPTYSDILYSLGNTFGDGSYVVVASLESGYLELYANYYAPEGTTGYWAFSGLQDLDDGKSNPLGTTEWVQSVIDEANKEKTYCLSFAYLNNDYETMIYTFTWFKDAIYWYSGSKVSSPGSEKYILVESGTDEDGDTTYDEVTSDDVQAGDTVLFELKSNVPGYLLDYVEYDYTNSSTAAAASVDDGVATVAATATSGSYVITFHDVLNSSFTLNTDSFTITVGDTVLSGTATTNGDGSTSKTIEINGTTYTINSSTSGSTTTYYITVGGTDYTLYTITYNAAHTNDNGETTSTCTFEISIDLVTLYLLGIIDDTDIANCSDIVVTYTATLSADATAGCYTNKSWVTYEETETVDSEVEVYTYGVKVYKYGTEEVDTTDEDGNTTTTETSEALSGAGFVLYRYTAQTDLTTWADGVTYYTRSETSTTTYTEVDQSTETFDSDTTYYTANTTYTAATGLTGFDSSVTYYTQNDDGEYEEVDQDAETFDSDTTYYTASTTYTAATDVTEFDASTTYYVAVTTVTYTYSEVDKTAVTTPVSGTTYYVIEYYKKTTTTSTDDEGNETSTTTVEWVTDLYGSDGETFNATVLYSDENGNLQFEGLEAGTYYLLEVVTPNGYVSSTSAVEITVPGNTETSYYASTSVENSKIPETGGMGTTILYIIGVLLVLCAGIILVTRRRMNSRGE